MPVLPYRALRPLSACRSGQEHIWFRVLGNNCSVPLERAVGKPFDLLVRVPASTLSNNVAQTNSTPFTYKNIQQFEFNHANLKNIRFLLVPKRKFGLGRKDPQFGHARFRGRIQFVEPFVFGMFFLSLTIVFIDWQKLKEEYGIDILPEFLYKGFTQMVDADGQVKY